MAEEPIRYTFEQVLERLLLTDEELLLCKQHREYAEKLDDMLDARDFRMDVNSIGDLVEKPTDLWGIHTKEKEQNLKAYHERLKQWD